MATIEYKAFIKNKARKLSGGAHIIITTFYSTDDTKTNTLVCH